MPFNYSGDWNRCIATSIYEWNTSSDQQRHRITQCSFDQSSWPGRQVPEGYLNTSWNTWLRRKMKKKKTEQKVLSVLSRYYNESFPADTIERAHRLRTFTKARCRPVIATFHNFKVQLQVPPARSRFKENNITISRFFSRHMLGKKYTSGIW